MRGARLWVVILLTGLGLGLLVAGAFVPMDWGKRDYVSGAAMSVGAALLLVPMIFWMEQQLARRLDSVEASLGGARLSKDAGRGIASNAVWEEVFPALDNVHLVTFHSAIFVKSPGQSLWIGFSTFRQWEYGKDCSMVMGYFSDPAVAGKQLDAVVKWHEGETGRDMLNALAASLIQHGRNLDVARTADPVFASLRQQIEDLLNPSST